MKRIAALFLALTILAPPARATSRPPVDIGPINFVPPVADRVVLSNGVAVYLYESHELPIFDMILLLKASPSDDRPPHAMDLLSGVWRSGGTAKRSPDALDEEL